MNPALQGLITIIIGVGGCIAYFYFSNQFLDRILFPGREETAKDLRRARLATVGILVGLPIMLLVLIWTAGFSIGVFAGFNEFVVATGPFSSPVLKLLSAALVAGIVSWLLAEVSHRILPPNGHGAGYNINRANAIRPWLFLFPAIFALGLYLAYPVFSTLWLSVTDRSMGGAFVGGENYARMFAEDKFWEAVRNNFLWLLVVPAASTAFGLLAAQLTDRISWGNIAKSLIFMPMAISFVGAAVIFKLIYDARPEDVAQIGVLNAVYLQLGGESPITWLTVPFWNNFFLMIVLIWIQTGFAMVILSAALRGIPEETVEAAIVDGANPFQIFFKIKIPQISGTIVVVWTTITIVVLKVFDIVFAMTNGQWETQVLANYMYDKLFRANDWGVGSASAMIIMLMVTPILVWNVYNARKEMR